MTLLSVYQQNTYQMEYHERHRYIEEIFKYCTTDSILIINRISHLERLYCPFYVEVIVDISALKKGDIKAVNAVRMSIELMDVYIIESKAYKCYNFIILGKVNID